MESAPQESVEVEKQDQDIWQTPTHDELPGVGFLIRHKWLESGLTAICAAGALIVVASGWLVCVGFITEIKPSFLNWLHPVLSPLVSMLDSFLGPMWVLYLLLTIVLGSAFVYVAGLPLLGLKSAFKADRWLTLALSMSQATIHAVVAVGATLTAISTHTTISPMTDDDIALIALISGGLVYLPVPVIVWQVTGLQTWIGRDMIKISFWFSVAMLIALTGLLLVGLGWHDFIFSLFFLTPIAMFTLTSGIVWASTRGLYQRQLKSLSSPTCPACGYDLRGSLIAKATLCPECGATIPARFTAKYTPAE